MQCISPFQKREEWAFKACTFQISLLGHPPVALHHRKECFSAKCQCVGNAGLWVYNGSGEK